MAARTAIAPVQLLNDNGVLQGAGTTINASLVTNGATVAAPGPFRLLLIVNNTDAAPHNLIVRASRSGVDASGNTQVNPSANTVFTQSTVGDLSVSVVNATTQAFLISSTDRFTQDDGSVSIDFAASFAGTIWVYRLPYVQPS